jgi:hypothetical protein
MSTKIIFLDVDGVLNWADTRHYIDGFIGFDPEHIERFNHITEAHPDAKIVISSTWRKARPFGGTYNDFEGLIELMHAKGLKGDIVGMTPILYAKRGEEIRTWIEGYETELGEKITFVVLDDDTSGMEGFETDRYLGKDELGDDVYEPYIALDLRPFHVVTTWDGEWSDEENRWTPGGLQKKHIEKAIGILAGGPRK